MEFRLIIDSKPRNAYENMSIDLAIQKLYKKPVLRFYGWNPAAVSIGRFQNIKKEVNLEFCKKNKIDVVRRVSGGGAVFHDKEVTYSLCIKEKNGLFPEDLIESYKSVCEGVIIGIKKLGLRAEYSPINDLLINGKKFSGCAQTRKEGIFLQHGTVLIDIDFDKMFSAINVSDEKIKDKQISNAKERVTSLKKELGREVLIDELVKNIVLGFKENFKIEFKKDHLSEEEIKLAKQLEQEIFKDEKWTYER
ncbi:MAG: biotin/lipoate A/B protein ligase family protein [Candidatus Pacearchaeota archaeon]|jgi:lipoate-protein ligase A